MVARDTMKRSLSSWWPAIILASGAVFTLGLTKQQEVPLRAPLDRTVPSRILSHQGQDVVISDEERRVAGMSDYLMRVYAPSTGSDKAAAFSLYVGYYENQTQGKTIHSPKNCLPGSGWEALTSRRQVIATAAGDVAVNRYLLQRGDERALVLYWYQGRGRIQANEYAVKLDLLRDAALKGRSEEALVRVIVPVRSSEAEAFAQAVHVAQTTIPAVSRALPATI